MRIGPGEIVQLVKCFQGKLENLGSNPSTCVKPAWLHTYLEPQGLETRPRKIPAYTSCRHTGNENDLYTSLALAEKPFRGWRDG